MNAQQLLDEILGNIRLIRDDQRKLELLLEFIQNKLAFDDNEELDKIPPAFEKVLKPIAEALDAGMVCFLNLDTLETEDLRPDWLGEDFDSEIDCGIPNEEWLPLKHTNWENCMEFEPLESDESFKIMSDFALQVKKCHCKINSFRHLAIASHSPTSSALSTTQTKGKIGFISKTMNCKRISAHKYIYVLHPKRAQSLIVSQITRTHYRFDLSNKRQATGKSLIPY